MTAIYRKAQLSNIAAVAFQLDSATPDNPTFVPADGLFVYNPDYKINPETITREGSRADISPMGVRTARKTATLTFSTELRAEGNYAARCGLGKLLLACGYEEHNATGTTAAARAIDPIKNADNTGAVCGFDVTGTAVNTLFGDYKIKAVLGGASTTAKLRVTGGVYPEFNATTGAVTVGDSLIGQSEVVTGWIDNIASNGTLTVATSTTNYDSPTFTFTGTPATGDVINLIVLGRDITYTLVAADDDTTKVATKVAAAITAQSNDLFAATGTLGVVTVTYPTGKSITVPNGTHTNNYNTGESVTVTALGIAFTYAAETDAVTPAQMATALELLIEASPYFTSSATDAVITVTFVGSIGGHSYVMTDGTSSHYLGNSGIIVTPDASGETLVAGDTWMAAVVPAGFYYKPISQNMKDAAIALYLDGTTHKMTRAKGTFTFDAKAGGTGVMNFTFTGNYHDPIDQEDESPVAVLVNELPPPIFELACFSYNQYPHYAAENFTFDQGNEVVIRPNYNAAEGYYGILITSRTPSGSFDPEAARIHEVDMWTPFADSSYAPLRIRFGTEVGNTIWMYAPATQVSENTYGDRNKIRTISTKLNFARAGEGNNEVIFAIA